ncbi:single-stranded-DNA-specific exonuclease RecJ [candidate division WWE3 bacterium RIFOXYC1_FULL_39_7]|uniref:Single-stranded-DNA-specific exonuclease RecJ n=2 Tax=Katanobacteria TaxID=422282 RepID=A0A1F4X8Q8_UNCKA|nr:MAG: single-stranded-DNA-specific exonuclease RecJ [candidate division WWE3 bacterium RIFOXYC1_FULL_39_7]OGC77453.1 MAG: single-stranded-DNA-specific exonuclease RecJ [candidate division WWE3 bacterium RIFOXYD1_FULL_39_9]
MKRWEIKKEYVVGDDIIKLLLENRGISTKQEIDDFLHAPPISELVKKLPREFRESLRDASELIKNHTSKNLPIVVHGDYDADGICATAILYKMIKNELKYESVYYFIPNRFDHGYGLSTESVNEVVNMLDSEGFDTKKGGLFITVDSGITAAGSVEFVRTLGFDIIITDHHQKPDKLPNANVIVWYDKVVGASISWILSRVLGSTDPQSLSLAAIATVTDLQPLKDLNREIVKKGLKILNSNPIIGLKKLVGAAGKETGELDTYDLGWIIGPRLNASGRLLEATNSLQLLLEEDATKAEELALKLNAVNIERQDKTLEMFEIASSVGKADLPKIIFSSDQNYHEGVIGLVAARLTQKFYRPSIVISLSEEFGKGSVRSIQGVDIISMLRKFDDLFENLGGHPMAAGFTIKKENISILEDKLLEEAENLIEDSLFERVLKVDVKIPVNIIDLELLEKIEELQPFGLGNEEPVFMSENLGVVSVDAVGKEKSHLIIKLFDGQEIHKSIYFNAVDNNVAVQMGDKLDIVYTIKKNVYNGKTYIDLVLKDLKIL